MARPKKEIEPVNTEVIPVMTETPIVTLTQEFTSISEMNILRDKLNEIIKKL